MSRALSAREAAKDESSAQVYATDLASETFSTLASTAAATQSSAPTNGAQDLHASAEPHNIRRQRRGVAPKEAAALNRVHVVAVFQGRQQAAGLRAVRQLQADLGEYFAEEGERLGDVGVRSGDVDIVADGADKQARPLNLAINIF